MDLRARLRQLADALPPHGSVTLTRADLVAWLEEEGCTAERNTSAVADLTIPEVAEQLGRKPSTVRTWVGEDRFPGAYRLRGREWRIPPAVLQAFLQREAAGEPRPKRREEAVDLGSWRRALRT